MRILFLTLHYPEEAEGNSIYSDLIEEFSRRGDQVNVVCQRERRTGLPTEFKEERGIYVLRVRTGNVTKTNRIEKGISTVLIERQYVNAIKKYLGNAKIDLLLYSTPPITFESVVKYIQQRDDCKTYLLLKDIFPQNAVDMGMLKKHGLLWQYFREKEKRLYARSDHIGCMSPANVEYVLQHNPEIAADKVEVCPNSISPALIHQERYEREHIRDRYGVPRDAVFFVYGGNLGRPQGIDFFLDVLDELKHRRDLYFLIVGSGTEYERIRTRMKEANHPNARLIQYLPKHQYDELIHCCDVGLIFLDAKFTIPNFPSRLTSYMEAALPIACATDIHTDLKDILAEAECGLWAESGDVEGFMKVIDHMAESADRRTQMGSNARRYLESHYTVSHSYNIIKAHL